MYYGVGQRHGRLVKHTILLVSFSLRTKATEMMICKDVTNRLFKTKDILTNYSWSKLSDKVRLQLESVVLP